MNVLKSTSSTTGSGYSRLRDPHLMNVQGGGSGGQLDMSSVELRARGSTSSNYRPTNSGSLSRDISPSDPTGFIERKIKDGETLQKIALHYSLPLSELKRINNLISEQDFYALSRIRIPVTRYTQVETLLIDNSVPSTSSAADGEQEERKKTAQLISFNNNDEDNEKQTNDGGISGRRPESSAAVGYVDIALNRSPNSPLSQSEDDNDQTTTALLLSSSPTRHGGGVVSAGRGSGTSTPGAKFKSMLKSVDATLEEAKSKTAQLVDNSDAVLADVEGVDSMAVFNPSAGAELRNSRAETAAMERSLRQYLIGVLVCFVILVPVGYLVYELIMKAEDVID